MKRLVVLFALASLAFLTSRAALAQSAPPMEPPDAPGSMSAPGSESVPGPDPAAPGDDAMMMGNGMMAPGSMDPAGMDPPMDPGADPGPGGMGRGHMQQARRGIMRRLQALDLSDDQWTKIREIHFAAQKEMIPKRADLQVKELDLRELLLDPKPDQGKVDATLDEIASARRSLAGVEVHALLQVRDVLTPEQLQKFLKPPMPGPRPAASAAPRGQMMQRRMGQQRGQR